MAAVDPDERREQLTTAPKADEADAAPRIEVTERGDGVRRIDVAETAAVRPGEPDREESGADE
ncbi:hypothetical protein [Agromyces aerolatus]|uniref:hypothetical protein n=1 Tax=Agromyces sp. LY-1074 TaxID=3074080 RepID=UPI0028603866|nr:MULTISPECIES: hypothetical protein [unclassified Agromyces]MDR5701836.1 hypothetical protein [Agromyces sp. LY-1074]MDR5708091.1 hypothetical protein [Agromyces sp. LY-1358]